MLPAQSQAASVGGHRYELGLRTICGFFAINLLLVVACLAALWQNRSLHRQVVDYEKLLTPLPGSAAPPLEGVDWRGARQLIIYGTDHRPTLIYNFSQKCPYCQKNWDSLRALQALEPQRLRIVYIDSVGDVFNPDYLAANGMSQSTLLVQLSPAAKYIYEARLMPQVLLVNAEGKVQWSHVGEFTPADISTALSMIGQN